MIVIKYSRMILNNVTLVIMTVSVMKFRRINAG
jgi:hypothetical protein